jgi:hypothetical protein
MIQQFITEKKQKKTENKNKDAPRTTHSIWSNKNIVSSKMTWYFYWWRRGAMGHPQALTLVLLGYLLGWYGNPQAWAFVHTSSHLIILLSLHLKMRDCCFGSHVRMLPLFECKKFCLKILTLRNIFFSIGSICTWEPNWISAWKLHTKLPTILISNIRVCKIVDPPLVQSQLKENTY